MTIYSVMPAELLWEGYAPSSPPQLKEISRGGLLLQVEPLEEGKAKIVRLLNGPLNAYLDDAWAPGSIINF